LVNRVVGIDLAASAAGTAFAVLADGGLERVEVGADDARLLDVCRGADKIGIDCPLGWPAAFVEFLAAHAAGRHVPAAATIAERNRLTYRETDRWVIAHYPPLRPLSVSADRIGHAALRCAGLLQALGEADRSGYGRVVEVYPTASLQTWRLRSRGYKRAAGLVLLDALATELGGYVDLGGFDATCRHSDHALDAVVAALSALAAQRGDATLPDRSRLAIAREEGWIAVPTCTLTELTTARPIDAPPGRPGDR
jgi:predicted nuclease with RNAse H fold